MLVEVEVLGEIAELRCILAHIGPRVRSAIGLRIKSLPIQKIVLDKFHERVEAERLMIDEAALRVGRNHQARNAQAVPVFIDADGNDMVVEPAPVVPGQKDGTVLPIGPLHDGVDQMGDIGLSSAQQDLIQTYDREMTAKPGLKAMLDATYQSLPETCEAH
jgi:hypothetical protein